jgi:indole-3-glycerol phosphate synthase
VALEAGVTIVGVNNRNLRTLAVDREMSVKAIDRIPDDVTAVAESGLKTSDDLRRLGSAGYDGFLIGESLMTTPDPGAALAALLAGAV